MIIQEIDISKSIEREKLVTKRWTLDRILEILVFCPFVIAWPLIASMIFFANTNSDQSGWSSLIFLVLAFAFSIVFLFALFNLRKLKRINGLSRGKNLGIIKKVVARKNWNLVWSTQQMALINFPNHPSFYNWGQQIIIVFDGNDVLINSMTFGLYSTPSPLHWFSNKAKINAFQKEFFIEKTKLKNSKTS